MAIEGYNPQPWVGLPGSLDRAGQRSGEVAALEGSPVSRVFKGVLMIAFGLIVLWWVAVHSGPREGTVIVHGMEHNIEVDLAGRTYYLKEPTDEPLVLPLPAGKYNFRVRRGDTVLHAETFVLQGGNSEVLVAIRDDRGVIGYDLRLMSSLQNAGGIPTDGKSLIVLAAVKNVLHFRIFDGDGKMVVDTDETKLTRQAEPIEALRKQLEGLWRPHDLTDGEKARVIPVVTSIVGHTRVIGPRPPD
jgi:hypothetical protein